MNKSIFTKKARLKDGGAKRGVKPGVIRGYHLINMSKVLELKGWETCYFD